MMAALRVPVFGNDVEVAPGVFDEAGVPVGIGSVESVEIAYIFGALIVGHIIVLQHDA